MNHSVANLTCGERVVRCLTGQAIDRVPFGVGLGWHAWGQTLQRWREESGQPQLDLTRHFGFERSFTLPQIHSGIFPEFEYQLLAQDSQFITFRDARGITRRERVDHGSMPEFLDHPVKNRQDWEKLKKDRLDFRTLGRIALDWDEFRSRLQATGEAVQVGSFPFGVFGMPRDLLSVEKLLLTFYDDPDWLEDMMDHLTNLWINLWQQVAQRVQIDHIHIWEDMAGKQGSLISPEMIRRFMMPCYDRIVAFARSAGVRIVSVDSDGHCRELAPVMTRHGINMMLPFEIQAGNDLWEYRQQYPELGIMGGLDKRALALDRKAIDKQVAIAARMIAAGRYVPGFDHHIPPDVPWENFQYAVARIKELCQQPPRAASAAPAATLASPAR